MRALKRIAAGVAALAFGWMICMATAICVDNSGAWRWDESLGDHAARFLVEALLFSALVARDRSPQFRLRSF
jgi:hypothetical protein